MSKSKRSFLDDDFFVMKKPKRKSPAASPRKSKDPGSDDPGFVSASDTPGSPVPFPLKVEKQEKIKGTEKNESRRNSDESQTDKSLTDKSQSDVPQNSQLQNPQGQQQLLDQKVQTTIESEPINLDSEPDIQQVPEEIVDDDPDTDLLRFFTKSETVTENDESRRLYNVKVTSKLGQGGVYLKQITGNTTFGQLVQILERETLRTRFSRSFWRLGALVWVEGRSELKPFFKPSTLRIPEPENGQPSQITCLFVPTEHLGSFEKLYTEFEVPAENALGDGDDNGSVDDLSIVEVGSSPAPNRSEYFVIGLKGKDNKRIEAEVGPTTKIRSLLKYYLQVKGLKNTGNCKLVFDDEELDLDAQVGDTELEEDFEVQVYL